MISEEKLKLTANESLLRSRNFVMVSVSDQGLVEAFSDTVGLPITSICELQKVVNNHMINVIKEEGAKCSARS